ncbi:GumC family protein [Nitrospira moscoviensis]|uniref:Putative Lipopolysaccharide biosynthesis protein n=1 Tax=Nitrospira moscoviensis TaxID=42253 RepID=A0A0K2GEM4_NITMO|nr:GNVR domain-containing protein [Nitrospira moscoviensis]ALA59062.1 putative Lipopolysaccharide biosynthesis protein [Nitrospira moscoviensis]
MQEEGPDSRAGLAQAAAIWDRRKWLALVLFAAPCAAFLSLVSTLPNLYSSTATVLVEQQQIPEGYVKSSVTGEADARLHMIREKILNRSHLKELIERFNLYPDLRKRADEESVVERMRKDITLELKELQRQVFGRDGTFGFKVSYRGRDPETVARVANTLAGEYVEENVKMRTRQASDTTLLLKKQLDEIKARHDEQERRIAQFQQRHMGELPDQIHVNLSTLSRLNQDLALNSEHQMRLIERRERLSKQLFDITAGGAGAAPHPESLAYQLEKLRTELTALRTRASHKHPDVQRLQGEIAAIEKALAEMAADAKLDPAQAAALLASPDDIRQALRESDRDLKNLKVEEQRLRQELIAYQRRVERSPQHAQEFQQLERDFKMTRDLYLSLLQRYEDALLAESMERARHDAEMRIIDPAMPSASPAAPNRTRLYLIGLALSLAIAAGGVMLAEYRDRSFHDVDELRAFTKVPILVRIPLIETKAERRKKAVWAGLRAAVSLVSLAAIVGAFQYLGAENEQLVWMLSEKPAPSAPR